MPPVQLARSAYERVTASVPELTLVNWMLESDPTSTDGAVYIQRPCLTNFAQVGNDRIRGIYPDGGILDGFSYFVVGGSQFAKVDSTGNVTNLFSPILNNSHVIFATSLNRVLLAHGGAVVTSDGTTASQITMPDTDYLQVGSVAYLAGFFLLATAGAQRIYFMTNGAAAPGALDYFSAEQRGDDILLGVAFGDEYWVFGRSIIEIFTPSGDANAPFTPQPGRAIETGCISRQAVSILDNSPFWVGFDLVVYRAAGAGPSRISTHGIEERLRMAYDDNQYLAINLWSYKLDGHAVLVLTAGQHGTFLYDCATQKWAEARTNGSFRWRVWQGAQNSSQIICGDIQTNQLYRLDQTTNTDAGSAGPMHREVTGIVEVTTPTACSNFYIKANPGEVNNPNAALQLSFSDDQGRTYGNPIAMPLGASGAYEQELIAFRLGQMKAPGRVFKIACDDDARVRISNATINEAVAR